LSAFQTGSPHSGFHPLDNQTALQFGDRSDNDLHRSTKWTTRTYVFAETNELDPEMIQFV
jgi:hypothetical protein